MIRKELLLAACAMLAISATAAKAADVYEPTVFDWSGFYAGLNAGYAFGGEDAVGLLPGFGNVGDLNLNGVYGGVGAGLNYQMDQIVLGIEGDIQLGDISDSDSALFAMSDDANYFGTLRARAGIAFDSALIYATGGLAFSSFDYEVVGPGVNIDNSFSKVGYVFGGGLEYAFDEAWSFKAEYLYASFGSKNLSSGGQTTKATPDFHTIRIGVNYHF